MRIQAIDNTQFGALIRIKSPEELFAQANQMMKHMTPNQRGVSALSSSTGISSSGMGIITGGSASNTAATTSDVIGSAYLLKATGIDSFGIVPSAAAKSSPYLTPASAESTAQNPATAGSLFTTIGGYIHRHFKIVSNKPSKIPS